MITITVGVATFNGEKYIIEQLESILRQSLQPDEVIISDDHSTDRTKELVTGFIEKNCLSTWRFIENNTKKGVTNNVLNVLLQSKGEIIFLCDQDDVWETNKIETIVNAFDDDVACVISAITYIDGNGKTRKSRTAYTNINDHYVDINELCSVCSYLGMSAAVKRIVVETIKKDFMMDTTHDWALMIHARELGKIKYIGKPLQRYRQHDNNASVIKDGTRKDRRIAFVSRQERIIKNSIMKVDREEFRSVMNEYTTFLNNRVEWIKTGNFKAIMRNGKIYKKLMYSTRNFVADILAALS